MKIDNICFIIGSRSAIVTSGRKSPTKRKRRSPSRLSIPGRDGSTRPGGGDRFIPNRSAMDSELCLYKLTREVKLHSLFVCGVLALPCIGSEVLVVFRRLR